MICNDIIFFIGEENRYMNLVCQVFDCPGFALITYPVFFFGSVIPLLKDSVGILMQRIPVGLERNVHIAYQRVSSFVHINLFSFVPLKGRPHKEWQIGNLTPRNDDTSFFVTVGLHMGEVKCLKITSAE